MENFFVAEPSGLKIGMKIKSKQYGYVFILDAHGKYNLENDHMGEWRNEFEIMPDDEPVTWNENNWRKQQGFSLLQEQIND